MSFIDRLQYQVENFSIYFQGGVRRGILIFSGVCLVLIGPSYFFGRLTADVWKGQWQDISEFVQPKTVTVNPYNVGETQVVELANGEKDLYLSVTNKQNREIGFFPWVYTIQILNDSDQLISQDRFESYLLPDETKFVVARSSDPSASTLRLVEEDETVPVSFNPLTNPELSNPDIEIRQQSVKVMEDGNLRIEALFKNNDIVSIGNMEILYIIRDTRQSVVGIGQFTFNGFKSGELRALELNYPQPASREPRSLDLRWTINYLDEDNIMLR